MYVHTWLIHVNVWQKQPQYCEEKKKKRAERRDEVKKNNNISAMQETHLHGSSRVGKIPWRKKWQPTPVSLPEQSRIWTEESGGLHAWVCKRVGHHNE